MRSIKSLAIAAVLSVSPLVAVGAFAALHAPSAEAYTTCNTIGGTTFCNGSSGSSTYSNVGGTTFYNTPYGSGSCSTIGSSTFCN